MVGYHVSAGTRFVPLTPARVLDTRDGTGVPAAPLGGGAVVTVNLDGVGGIPKAGVAAVAVNITAIGGTSASFLTVFPAGTPLPNASNVNFLKGQTVPNLAVVPTGGNASQISVFNSYGSSGGVHVIGDVVGYFT